MVGRPALTFGGLERGGEHVPTPTERAVHQRARVTAGGGKRRPVDEHGREDDGADHPESGRLKGGARGVAVAQLKGRREGW